ncbi:MAG: hypothetical protein JNG90_07545 [Planctomycetaceae bacterium]|nr:hypothetical protein [Planctomycetaceae bacterium]
MEIQILTEFAYRLAFGLALAMACTSPRLVTSGYFRVHSYVLLGLASLSALVAASQRDRFDLWPALAAAVASYLASAVWLYEKWTAGRVLLVVVAMFSLIGAWLALPAAHASTPAVTWLDAIDTLASGLLLGSAMAAMLLGHWYLNTPSMQLAPLQRLVLILAGAVALRALVSLVGLGLEVSAQGWPSQHLAFVALRWLAGIVGTGVVAAMTWQTLKIPNTQSATGILYVGVITTFLGELTAQLLSSQTLYPL